MQEAPQFVLFSRGEKGGAAQVRNILNRAVGAQEDAIRQVRNLSADTKSLHSHEYQLKQLHGRCAVLMVCRVSSVALAVVCSMLEGHICECLVFIQLYNFTC